MSEKTVSIIGIVHNIEVFLQEFVCIFIFFCLSTMQGVRYNCCNNSFYYDWKSKPYLTYSKKLNNKNKNL